MCIKFICVLRAITIVFFVIHRVIASAGLLYRLIETVDQAAHAIGVCTALCAVLEATLSPHNYFQRSTLIQARLRCDL